MGSQSVIATVKSQPSGGISPILWVWLSCSVKWEQEGLLAHGDNTSKVPGMVPVTQVAKGSRVCVAAPPSGTLPEEDPESLSQSCAPPQALNRSTSHSILLDKMATAPGRWVFWAPWSQRGPRGLMRLRLRGSKSRDEQRSQPPCTDRGGWIMGHTAGRDTEVHNPMD